MMMEQLMRMAVEMAPDKSWKGGGVEDLGMPSDKLFLVMRLAVSIWIRKERALLSLSGLCVRLSVCLLVCRPHSLVGFMWLLLVAPCTSSRHAHCACGIHVRTQSDMDLDLSEYSLK